MWPHSMLSLNSLTATFFLLSPSSINTPKPSSAAAIQNKTSLSPSSSNALTSSQQLSESMAAASSSSASALVLLFLLFGLSAAREILVGGKTDAWKIPSSQSDSLNQWAERSRFQVGDHIVWKYEGGRDSVLQVNKEDYANCNISNPIGEYSDGNTKVKLDRPGPFYFISGANGHCEKGQKLVVVVLTPRNRHMGFSPAPSPAEFEGPAVAPTSSATALQGDLIAALVLALWFF